MYERKVKYTSISIAEPLMDAINTHIKKHKQNVTAGSFVRDAIRLKMDIDEGIMTLNKFTDASFNRFSIEEDIKAELKEFIKAELKNQSLKPKKK